MSKFSDSNWLDFLGKIVMVWANVNFNFKIMVDKGDEIINQPVHPGENPELRAAIADAPDDAEAVFAAIDAHGGGMTDSSGTFHPTDEWRARYKKYLETGEDFLRMTRACGFQAKMSDISYPGMVERGLIKPIESPPESERARIRRSIDEAKGSFEALYRVLRGLEEIPGDSQGLSGERWVVIIKEVREGDEDPKAITNACGLRGVVKELMKKDDRLLRWRRAVWNRVRKEIQRFRRRKGSVAAKRGSVALIPEAVVDDDVDGVDAAAVAFGTDSEDNGLLGADVDALVSEEPDEDPSRQA